MTGSERRERSHQLMAQLSAPPLGEISTNQLGKAAYAWLLSSKAAKPYNTPTGAAQTFRTLRQGNTVGALNIERTEMFLGAIEGDPIEWAAQWSGENGDEPTRELPPELAISEETKKALAGAFGQVRLLYDQKKSELMKKEDELSGLRSEVRRMEGILKTAGILPRQKREGHPGRRPKQEPQTRGSHVSDAKAAEILTQLKAYVASTPPALEDTPGSFTRPEIEKTLKLHHSQVGAAVEKLREQGFVRAAGLTMGPNGRKTNVYVVVG